MYAGQRIGDHCFTKYSSAEADEAIFFPPIALPAERCLGCGFCFFGLNEACCDSAGVFYGSNRTPTE